ncbi:MAG: hypothetical protein J5699_06825 [Bacteroidales bacterium]|nr:hypothetical protein [Bacteroidales bacterium]
MLEEVKGKTIIINKPSYAIYTALSDLNNIAAALPEQYRDKVTIDNDTIIGQVQGFSIGVKVNNRTPFSRIDFEQAGQMPFPFLLSFFTEPSDDNTTYFHIELRAELNTLMKMMFGKRLQEIVDKLTDGISAAAAGQMPEGWEQFK